MNRNTRYYSYRIRLEKLQQRKWLLIVFAKALFFLAILISYYLRQA